MNGSQAHPSIAELADLVEGRLAPEDAQRVEEHLASGCSTCAAELAWLRETLALMTSDDWVNAPAPVRARVRQAFRQRYARPRARPSLRERLQAFFLPGLRWAFAATLALVLLVAAGLVLRTWRANVVPEKAALVNATGRVEVIPRGSTAWRPATVGEPIAPGARIRTGPSSKAVLAFPDGSETRLEGSTELAILQLRSGRQGKRLILLQQPRGRTYNRVRELPLPESRFEIRTPAAVVTVRGTEFAVAVAPDGQTRVSVVSGAVEVTAQGVTVRVAANEETTVRPGEAPATPVPTVPATPSPLVSPSPTGTASPTPSRTPSPGLTSTPEREVVHPTTPAPESGRTRTPTATARPTHTPKPPAVVRPTKAPTHVPEPTHTRAPTEAPEPTEPPESPKPTEAPEATHTAVITHTPQPTEPPPSATAIPTSTNTPQPTASLKPTEGPEATPTPHPTPSREATESPEPTEEPEATDTPRPTDTLHPTSTPRLTEPPEPTEGPEPTDTEEATARGRRGVANTRNDGARRVVLSSERAGERHDPLLALAAHALALLGMALLIVRGGGNDAAL